MRILEITVSKQKKIFLEKYKAIDIFASIKAEILYDEQPVEVAGKLYRELDKMLDNEVLKEQKRKKFQTIT